MGNAGRVLMIPKGDYNPATPYEMLDCVYYNGRSYVCKERSTGNLPTNTTYWQAMTPDSSTEIQALTNYVADNNVKNMCPTFPASGSAAGVDYTTAANGIVTGVGTSTGQTAFYAVNQVANVLPAGNYIASAGSNASEDLRLVVLIIRANNSSVYIECTSSQDKPFTVYADDQFMSIYIRTNGGNTAINGTIAPMIRDASISDNTYQPHAKTNVELTADVSEIKNGITLGGYFTGDIDKINNQYGYMYSVDKSKASGTYPTGSGSVFLLMGFSSINSSENVVYGVQIALSFTTSTIHIRHFDYTAGGGTWGAWSQLS